MNVRNLFLSTVLVVFSLLVTEAGLRLFTPFPIYSDRANRVDDPYLIYRLSSSLKDADENGFRNPVVPDKVDIATLGDSHTYGFNVGSEHSWPQQLAKMSGMTVYNFGMGGYGSLQYYYQIGEAIKLKPKYVILALYLPNDLNDVCKTIIKLPYWQTWAEEHGFDTNSCYESGKPHLPYQPPKRNLIDLLRENTAIGSLVSYVWKLATERFNRGVDGEVLAVEDENNPTLIKTDEGEGLSGIEFMDLGRRKISLGYEITRYILKEAKSRCDANNIQFSVVFIPSKVRVYFNYLQARRSQLHDGYYKLVANEKNLLDRFSSMLDKLSVRHVDAGPYVLLKLNNTRGVYMHSSDDHPLTPGYSAYAEAVYENLLVPD